MTETSEKIASGITCATLTPEEQTLTLAETNLQLDQSKTSVTTTSSCISDKGSAKETCIVGQDTLTPEGHEMKLTETSENTTPQRQKTFCAMMYTRISFHNYISENQFEIASSTTCVTLTPEEQKLTLAETNLQFLPKDKSVTATSGCVLGERHVKETCLIGQKTSTLTPEGHEAGLTETGELLLNSTEIKAVGIMSTEIPANETGVVNVIPNTVLASAEHTETEKDLHLYPIKTICSGTASRALDNVSCTTGSLQHTNSTDIKQLQLLQELTPESHLTNLSTTPIFGNQFEIASGTTSVMLTPEEQQPTLAESNLQLDQSETLVTTPSNCIPDKRPVKETCLVGQDIAPEGHETVIITTSCVPGERSAKEIYQVGQEISNLTPKGHEMELIDTVEQLCPPEVNTVIVEGVGAEMLDQTSSMTPNNTDQDMCEANKSFNISSIPLEMCDLPNPEDIDGFRIARNGLVCNDSHNKLFSEDKLEPENESQFSEEKLAQTGTENCELLSEVPEMRSPSDEDVLVVRILSEVKAQIQQQEDIGQHRKFSGITVAEIGDTCEEKFAQSVLSVSDACSETSKPEAHGDISENLQQVAEIKDAAQDVVNMLTRFTEDLLCNYLKSKIDSHETTDNLFPSEETIRASIKSVSSQLITHVVNKTSTDRFFNSELDDKCVPTSCESSISISRSQSSDVLSPVIHGVFTTHHKQH